MWNVEIILDILIRTRNNFFIFRHFSTTVLMWCFQVSLWSSHRPRNLKTSTCCTRWPAKNKSGCGGGLDVYVKVISAHFSYENLNFHFLLHDTIRSRYGCITFSVSISSFAQQWHSMSSAYSKVLIWRGGDGKSDNITLKSVGLRGDPCGTPVKRRLEIAVEAPTLTENDRSWREDVNQLKQFPATPALASFKSRAGIHVESYALLISKKIAVVVSLLWLLSNIVLQASEVVHCAPSLPETGLPWLNYILGFQKRR